MMKYEIQYRIKELLDTIEEALEYIINSIEEQKHMGVEYLLDDIQDAVESIENAILENNIYIDIEKETEYFLKELKLMKSEVKNNEAEDIDEVMSHVKYRFNEWKIRVKNEITPKNIS